MNRMLVLLIAMISVFPGYSQETPIIESIIPPDTASIGAEITLNGRYFWPDDTEIHLSCKESGYSD